MKDMDINEEPMLQVEEESHPHDED